MALASICCEPVIGGPSRVVGLLADEAVCKSFVCFLYRQRGAQRLPYPSEKVSLGGDSILQRLKDGALVYADPEQAQVAVTGRGAVTPIGVNTWEAQFSDARPIEVQDASVADFVKPLNPYFAYFAGWSQARFR